jgi:transposase
MKPCIAIDISKGKSYYQAFAGLNEPHTKAVPIGHDRDGYERLTTTGEELKRRYGDVVYVFEATGIYHKSLQNHLEIKNERYVILNPLEAAKVRKSKLRSTKTDMKDCQSIALAYYTRESPDHDHKAFLYETLMTMSRHYGHLSKVLRIEKVRFRNLLDVVCPKWDEAYPDPYTEISLELLKQYPHPEKLRSRKEETIAKHLEKTTIHRHEVCMNETRKAKRYAEQAMSSCSEDACEVSILCDSIERIAETTQMIEARLNEMTILVQNDSFYEQLRSVPGIGEILSVRLIAELGDLDRFTSKRQLAACAGIDPIVYQSGQRTGNHLSITKKGNKRLRTLLYLAVTANIRIGKSNPILAFYNKKRQQTTPMVHRAAVIACANKLLRTLYSMHRSGKRFES